MPRRFIRRNNWELGGQSAPEEGESGEPKSKKRRLATTLVFTTLFFAGASLAAVAGDQLTPLSGEDSQQLSDTTTTTNDAETTTAATDPAWRSLQQPTPALFRPMKASTSFGGRPDAAACNPGAASAAALVPRLAIAAKPIREGRPQRQRQRQPEAGRRRSSARSSCRS